MTKKQRPFPDHFFALLPVILICLVTENPLHAQEQRFKGGIVAGINLSQIDGDKLSGYNQIGVNAGGRVAAILADRWQLSMELLFSQQGSNRTTKDDPSAALEKIRLNLVEVPVMINFLEWKFHVSAGVSYARVISYKVEDVLEGDISALANYKENLILFIVGATYYFNDHVGLSIAWSKALSDLQGEPGGGKLIPKNLHIKGVYMF